MLVVKSAIIKTLTETNWDIDKQACAIQINKYLIILALASFTFQFLC